jgi:hypothetical protein
MINTGLRFMHIQTRELGWKTLLCRVFTPYAVHVVPRSVRTHGCIQLTIARMLAHTDNRADV